MANLTQYKFLDACREEGCPVCRVEQESVERYLQNHFYENVNSPKWRDRLRRSLGFCHEHSWLAVDRRLGDALGFSILYRDILNNMLRTMESGDGPGRSTHHWTALLRRVPEQARTMVERTLYAITPAKQCPVCEHRQEKQRAILSALVEGLEDPEVMTALQSSEGLCLPHLQRALELVRDAPTCEKLLSLQREKLESLKDQLAEFIRKNDYQVFAEGFGREGDAWRRAVALVVGARRSR